MTENTWIGSKPLRGPLLILMYDAIWHHIECMSHHLYLRRFLPTWTTALPKWRCIALTIYFVFFQVCFETQNRSWTGKWILFILINFFMKFFRCRFFCLKCLDVIELLTGHQITTTVDCFTSHVGEHRTVCSLWKRQGIPCFCKIPTVQQSPEMEMRHSIPCVYLNT